MRQFLPLILALGILANPLSAAAQDGPATPEENARADQILAACTSAVAKAMDQVRRAQSRGASLSCTVTGANGSKQLNEADCVEFQKFACFVQNGLQDPIIGPRIKRQMSPKQHAAPNV